MTENNVNRAITTLIVCLIIWCVSNISTLIASDGKQEVQIKNGVEANSRLLAKQGVHSEHLSGVQSKVNGLSVSIDIIIKNQDRILNKLDGR